MRVFYEWDVESVDTETGDVTDHNHFDSYAEAVEFADGEPDDGEEYKVVLVRDDDNGRSWAYVEDGKLPGHFEDAYCRNVAKVPQKFVREVERAA